MTTKAILEAALQLPERSRARLVGKLLDSLNEPTRNDVILAGAKLAERRLQALINGKTTGIPEEEAHRRLFGKKKS
jgi:putative addiction module component (TIGR02574 family)